MAEVNGTRDLNLSTSERNIMYSICEKNMQTMVQCLLKSNMPTHDRDIEVFLYFDNTTDTNAIRNSSRTFHLMSKSTHVLTLESLCTELCGIGIKMVNENNINEINMKVWEHPSLPDGRERINVDEKIGDHGFDYPKVYLAVKFTRFKATSQILSKCVIVTPTQS